MKYLGLPLITTRLSEADCKPLIDSILARIKGWIVRALSFAGRLQLITSVISSIQVFWSSLLTLPKKIINKIEQLMRNFLWKGPDQQRGELNKGSGAAETVWTRTDPCRVQLWVILIFL